MTQAAPMSLSVLTRAARYNVVADHRKRTPPVGMSMATTLRSPGSFGSRFRTSKNRDIPPKRAIHGQRFDVLSNARSHVLVREMLRFVQNAAQNAGRVLAVLFVFVTLLEHDLDFI